MNSVQQPPSWDYQKWAHELRRSEPERAHDKLDEFHRYTNEASINGANLALRMALLINGGAAIALLSFDGHLPTDQMKAVANTLLWFAWGVLASVAGIALAYFTNYCMAGVAASKNKSYDPPYVMEGPGTWKWVYANRAFHVLAVASGVSSLILFIVGMFAVRAALT
jgi:hypothetical protein